MADILTSLAIYPITGNHVVAMLSSNLGGGSAKEVYMFFEGDCEEKKRIINMFYWTDYKISLILAKEQINCDFLIEEKKKGFYLYTY